MQLRSFYLGGDAHLYYASKQYIFERPPNVDAAETMTSSSPFGSDATKTTSAVLSKSQTMEGSGNTVSSSGATATTCAAGSLGGAWLAYETAEFAPWEEMLLDATAWMIAFVLCWDPMRGHGELEDDDDYERPKNRQRRRDATTGRSRQQQVAEDIDKEDNPCECDRNNPNDDHSNKRN